MLNEIEEFYSYVEMPQVAENMKAWEGCFQGGLHPQNLFAALFPQLTRPCFTRRMDQSALFKAPRPRRTAPRKPGAQRRRDPFHKRPAPLVRPPRSVFPFRFCVSPPARVPTRAPRIGTFGETTSQEHQLHWIFENCKLVRAANGVPAIQEAIKIASAKHDFLRCEPF
jgi:hypothetical protein